MLKVVLPLLILSACVPQSSGPEEDVQFVLLGKTRNYRQSGDGSVAFLNTVFFGEIFLNEGGSVTNGYVTGPGEAKDGLYFGDQKVPFLAGNRHTSTDALELDYPDGTYYFNYDTPHGNVRDQAVTFTQHEGRSRYPSPISIHLSQDSLTANPEAIDPNKDLVVTWSSFEYGAADPNGIIDDMIYVILGNCSGEKIVHSGPAFSEASLTFRATEFTITKESLHPGQPFQLEVEFSEMDTDRQADGISIVTYAASTFLDIRTTGENAQDVVCPTHPYAMDGGQTDREKPSN